MFVLFLRPAFIFAGACAFLFSRINGASLYALLLLDALVLQV